MTESVYYRREFIALASLALPVPGISSSFADISSGLEYYHSGRDRLEWGRDVESFHRFESSVHIIEMVFPCSIAHFPVKYAYWDGGKRGRGYDLA